MINLLKVEPKAHPIYKPPLLEDSKLDIPAANEQPQRNRADNLPDIQGGCFFVGTPTKNNSKLGFTTLL